MLYIFAIFIALIRYWWTWWSIYTLCGQAPEVRHPDGWGNYLQAIDLP